jgi:hypothetical protein
MALCGELTLEEAVDLSEDRLKSDNEYQTGPVWERVQSNWDKDEVRLASITPAGLLPLSPSSLCQCRTVLHVFVLVLAPTALTLTATG